MKVSVLVLMMLMAAFVFTACDSSLSGDAPTGLRIEDYDETSVTLAWDSVSGADGYRITWEFNEAETSSTSYRVSGLTGGTMYTFNVSAYKGATGFKGKMEGYPATIGFAPQIKYYTVTFESNGGSYVNSLEVNSVNAVSRPADPTREGYAFAGWYTDSALSKAYNFATPVSSDMTLYAKWTALARYHVKFEWNNGSEPLIVMVYSGQTVRAPETPDRAGYTFAGWYMNSSFTMLYDFTIPVSKNITLYAQWTH